jgi:hypothetical protein
MSKLLDAFVKDDPLKGFDALLRGARFEPSSDDGAKTTSISLLVLIGIGLAFARMLYGAAGFSLIQHAAATTSLMIVGYIAAGFAAILFGAKYRYVSSGALTLLVCVASSTIVMLTALLWFGSVTTLISESISSVINYGFGSSLQAPDWINIGAPYLSAVLSSAFYSIIGCGIVAWLHRNDPYEFSDNQSKRRKRRLKWFGVFAAATCAVLYFTAIERQGFFDNAMVQIAKIKIFSEG